MTFGSACRTELVSRSIDVCQHTWRDVDPRELLELHGATEMLCIFDRFAAEGGGVTKLRSRCGHAKAHPADRQRTAG
jgi:hypothetical protein